MSDKDKENRGCSVPSIPIKIKRWFIDIDWNFRTWFEGLYGTACHRHDNSEPYKNKKEPVCIKCRTGQDIKFIATCIWFEIKKILIYFLKFFNASNRLVIWLCFGWYAGLIAFFLNSLISKIIRWYNARRTKRRDN